MAESELSQRRSIRDAAVEGSNLHYFTLILLSLNVKEQIQEIAKFLMYNFSFKIFDFFPKYF